MLQSEVREMVIKECCFDQYLRNSLFGSVYHWFVDLISD